MIKNIGLLTAFISKFIKSQILLIIATYILSGCGKNRQTINLKEKFENFQLSQLDTFKIPKTSISSYITATSYAIVLATDRDSAKQIKGEVLLAIIGDHLKNEIEKGELDNKDDSVKVLINIYEQRGYLINHPPVNNFLKLSFYLCEGRYKYILYRFYGKWYFYVISAVIALVFTFSFVNMFLSLGWKYRKKYNIYFFIFVAVALIVGIIFKKTCLKCVTSNSFYGISI